MGHEVVAEVESGPVREKMLGTAMDSGNEKTGRLVGLDKAGVPRHLTSQPVNFFGFGGRIDTAAGVLCRDGNQCIGVYINISLIL